MNVRRFHLHLDCQFIFLLVSETPVRVAVQGRHYIRHLVDNYNFNVNLSVEVVETGQIVIVNEDISLQDPELHIEVIL